jgi:hypothetical protein
MNPVLLLDRYRAGHERSRPLPTADGARRSRCSRQTVSMSSKIPHRSECSLDTRRRLDEYQRVSPRAESWVRQPVELPRERRAESSPVPVGTTETFSSVCSKQAPRLFTGECLSLTTRPSAGSGLTGSVIFRRVSETVLRVDRRDPAGAPTEGERCRFQ